MPYRFMQRCAEEIEKFVAFTGRIVFMISGSGPDRNSEIIIRFEKPLMEIALMGVGEVEPSRRICDVAVDDHEVGIQRFDEWKKRIL